MNATGRRIQRLLSAAVAAAFAAFWLLVVATSAAPEFPSQYAVTAIATALVALPWVIASRILWRAFWLRHGERLAVADGPTWTLAAAIAATPDERREWGAAMAAELEHVQGRSARWRFAAGCARAALFPPRRSALPVLATAALAAAAAAAAAVGVGHALPAMRIFALTFVALAGALATLAVARSHRVRAGLPGPILSVAGVCGVAASVAVTANFLVKYPTAASRLTPALAMLLAVALAGCLGLALMPPRGLTTHRSARGYGAGATVVLALGFLATSRWTLHTLAGPVLWVMLAPAVIFFAASALTAAVSRSLRAGVQAGVWTALVGTLLVFAVCLPEAMYRYGIEARLLLDGEMGYPIDANLGDAIWLFVVIPVLGLPFGVIGASVGRRLRGAPVVPFGLGDQRG